VLPKLKESQATDGRRTFLKWVVGLAGSLVAAIGGIPFLGAALFPVRARTIREGEGFIPVLDQSDLPSDAFVKAVVRTTRFDAWSKVKDVELATVWLRKRDDGSVLAFSSICPHLGCSVDYLPESRSFNCPCHGSAFTPDGRAVSGPSPRPLDVLEARIEGGQVLVKLERFATGSREQRKA
jgi:menaquinol-cytochrome c reductase iron-sulfur subunit